MTTQSVHTRQNVVFVGSLSFEARSFGALRALGGSPRSLRGVMLDYASEATPGRDAARLRGENWSRIDDWARSRDWQLERRDINPYSMEELEEVLEDVLESCDPSCPTRLVIDISCMTKVHVITSAMFLATKCTKSVWSVAYSSPSSYGRIEASHDAGWRGTLTLPLGPDPSMRNEGMALGLLVAGAEAGRTLLALDELEPSAGLICVLTDSNRPDLHRNTERQNRAVFEHLRSLHLAGPGVDRSSLARLWPDLSWSTARIRTGPEVLSDLQRPIQTLVTAAKDIDAPVALYPIGPKIGVFVAAANLCHLYAQASWAIYPVLTTHPLDYSHGIAQVEWFDGADVLAHATTEMLDAARAASTSS